MEIHVGSKIKSLRKEKQFTIADLAELAGISSSMISQIENDKVVPTIIVMWKISKALEVNVGYFFDEEDSTFVNPVVRKHDRKRLSIGKSNRLYEMLVPDLNRKIEFLLITIKTNDTEYKDQIAHEGEECGHILKGTMRVHIDEQVYILEEGDSISFDSSIPHRYENIGDCDCVSIWAMTPPSF